MASKHIVEQGECIESIAFKHGFFWETIWNHPENKELRAKRKNPNVLRPGDEVYIPDKRQKTVDCATTNRHVFRLKGVPSKLDIVIKVNDQVQANTPYVLEVDGGRFEGTTDGDGRLVHPISPRAKRGKLQIGEGDQQKELDIALGHMDPIGDISGVQSRLNNLGFHCGNEDGDLDPLTVQAIREFQLYHDLDPTGEIDEKTRSKLLEQHGC